MNLGRNSDLIELSDTHLLVLRKLEHQQTAQKPLSEVREQIQNRLRQQVARQKVNEQLQQAQQRLQKGESPEKLAKAIKGAKWTRTGLIHRTAKDDKSKKTSKLEPEVRRKAFALPRPQNKKPSWGTLELANGDSVVVGLYKVKLADIQKQAKQDQQRLAQSNGSTLFARLLEQQRLQADVEINLPKDDE